MGANDVEPMAARTRIVIRNVVKAFDSRVVVDIDELVLGEHPIEGLIGPNGAGKTTLMRLIMHSIALDAGVITMVGPTMPGGSAVLSKRPSHEIVRLGCVKSNQVVQDFAPLTVYDSLMLPLAKRRDERPYRVFAETELWQQHAAEVWEYLDLFELDHLQGFARSAGEKKLLDIIRCLLLQPQVLLLDEPTAGLPAEVRTRVMRFIRRLAIRHNVSVVIVEHDLNVIWSLSNYVHFMAEGKVMLQGEPDWVRQHDTVVEKYLGSAHARR